MKKMIIALLLVCVGLSANAEPITGVGASATTTFSYLQDVENLVNNAGLSIPDDFTATHVEQVSSVSQWHSSGGIVDNEAVTFDLGGTYNLSTIYIWQSNQTSLFGRGVNQFDLLVSANGIDFTEVASDLNLAISTGGPNSAQSFALFQLGVTHVRIGIDTAHSALASEIVGLAEVKFDAIPEPATMGLVALFSGGLFLVRRVFQI